MKLKITFNNQVMSALCDSPEDTTEMSATSVIKTIREVLDQQGSSLWRLSNVFDNGQLTKEGNEKSVLVVDISDEAIEAMNKNIETIPTYIQKCLFDEADASSSTIRNITPDSFQVRPF